MSRIYYLLFTGVVLIFVVFYFIVQQNFILVRHDKSKGYSSYNQKKGSPAAIIKYWKENEDRTSAVKRIVFLDYCLMVMYGSLIGCGLIFFAKHQKIPWLRYFLRLGILLVIVGVACDAIRDNAIFEHLTKNTFRDFRYLTTYKFSCILLSMILLIAGMIGYQKNPRPINFVP